MARIKFEFIPSHVLAIAGKEEHAQYFKDVGLANFVSQVPWSENVEHSKADMLELIQNFDSNLAESRVNGMVISLSLESVRTMFRLGDGWRIDIKNPNYSPKSFSCNDRGKINRAYRLHKCMDDLVRERLEFQLTTLHMKGKRVETDVALCEIQLVEEAVHADWGNMLASRLVKKISKAQESLVENSAKAAICDIGSHLQVILNMARSPSCYIGLTFPVTMESTVRQPTEREQEKGAMCHKDDVNFPGENNEWRTTLHLTSEQPVVREPTGSCCSKQCMEIVEELKREYTLMSLAHATMTRAIQELSMELGTLKTMFKEVYADHTKGKADNMQVTLLRDLDSDNMMPPSSCAEKNNIETLQVGVQDKRSFAKSCKKQAMDNQEITASLSVEKNSTKSSGKKATDIQVHEVIIQSLSPKDNGAQWNGKVPNSEEDHTVGDKGGIPCLTIKACPNQPVKHTKLQQQKLLLPHVNMAMHKPQLVKRKLDMNIKASSKSSQGEKRRRPRRMWSKEETDYLVSAVHRYGEKWAVIARGGIGILVDRNEGDCKDKWRNVNKAGD